MALQQSLIRNLRSLDRHELRQVLILARGLLLARGEAAEPSDLATNVTYRLEAVRCGKQGCRSCPHGPYWYAYYREGSRLRSRYVGKHLPTEISEVPPGDLSE